MKTLNQRDTWQAVATGEPFRISTGAFRAEMVKTADSYTYYVFSYDEMIGWVKWKVRDNGLRGDVVDAWLTTEKFSVTTSKHTSYARRGIEYIMGKPQGK